MRIRSRLATAAVGALLAVSPLAAVAAQPVAAAPAAPATLVNGTWRLHTNDCFFGVCTYKFKLYQVGHDLDSTKGNGIRGKIDQTHIIINFWGVSSEDDWTCRGTIDTARTKVTGIFQDGTGGHGTCVAHKL